MFAPFTIALFLLPFNTLAQCPVTVAANAGPMPIKVYFNPTNASGCVGADCWYYELTEVERELVAAVDLWNTSGGAMGYFQYMGTDYGKTTANPGEVLVDFEVQFSACDANRRAHTDAAPGTVLRVIVYKSGCSPPVRRWAAGWPVGADMDLDWFSLYAVYVHELGHILGFNHPTGGATCNTVMGGYSGLRETQWLWPEDTAALRGLYGNRANANIRHRRSTDLGQTWFSETDPTALTNMSPAVAYGVTVGAPFGNNGYVVAYVDPSNNLRTYRTNGAFHEAGVLVGSSRNPPAVAFGNNTWIVVSARNDNPATASASDHYDLLYYTSADGRTWSTAATITPQPIRSAVRPSVAYDSAYWRFLMAYADFPYSDTTDGRLCIITGAIDGGSQTVSWGSPSCTTEPSLLQRTLTGPAQCCIANPNYGTNCSVFFANATGFRDITQTAVVYSGGSGLSFLDEWAQDIFLDEYANQPVSCAYSSAGGANQGVLSWRGFYPMGSEPSSSIRVANQDCELLQCKVHDSRMLSSTAGAGTSLAYGALWSEFALYFGSQYP